MKIFNIICAVTICLNALVLFGIVIWKIWNYNPKIDDLIQKIFKTDMTVGATVVIVFLFTHAIIKENKRLYK